MSKYPLTEKLLEYIESAINGHDDFDAFWNNIKTNPYAMFHFPEYESSKTELENLIKNNDFNWIEKLEQLKIMDPYWIHNPPHNVKLENEEFLDFFKYWYWDYYFPEKSYSETAKEQIRRVILKYMSKHTHHEGEWINAEKVFEHLKTTYWPALEYHVFKGLFRWNVSTLTPSFISEEYRIPGNTFSRITKLQLVYSPKETYDGLIWYLSDGDMPYSLVPIEADFESFIE
jgi:hypothetical protein